MDITLDVGELYFGLNAALKLEEDLIALSNAVGSVSVSSELPSAGEFNSMKAVLSSAISGDLDDLIVRLENSKRILQENDTEAAMLFSYFDDGIINGYFEFTDMPLLDQKDYPHIKYSQGTVASSGCGITAVCMVASYFTGKLYTPDDLAAMANKNGTSNVDRMTWAADYVGLKWYCNENTSTDDLKRMLKEGKTVICLVNGSTHFVVCKGITEDEKILVNDPNGPWAKDEPYTLGELNMSCGKTWVFDPAQNQHFDGKVDTDITVEADVVDKLQNENGFTGRESTPGDGGFIEESIPNNDSGNTVGGTEAPSTTPATTPSTSASTTPSTTPATSPSTSASTTPSTTPATSPSTSASTTPSTTPVTSPSTSVSTTPSTTPATSPSTSASTTPSTTPVTTPSTTPVTSVPVTTPVTESPTVPVTEAPVTTPPAEIITTPIVENEVVVGGNTSDGSSDVGDNVVDSTSGDNSSNVNNNLNIDTNTNIDNNYTNGFDNNYINDNYVSNEKEPPIITTTTQPSSKNDYSKYIIPGVVGTALVGGTAATYGVLKNKDKKKNDKDNNDDNGDISLSDF